MKRFIIYYLLFIICSAAVADTAMIYSLTNGEITSRLEGRSDIRQYHSACRELANMYSNPHGGVTKRQGTYYIPHEDGVTITPGTPAVPGGDYTEYFVGFNEFPATQNKPLVNATSESEVDTTWGTNGYWGYGSIGDCREGTQLSDGSLLVIDNIFTITKLDTDGVIDTSWATSGQYTHPQDMPFTKILIDDSENSHLFSWSGGVDIRYTYIKLDSDGVFVGGLTRSTTRVGFINDAQWADDDKTRILAVGQYSKAWFGTWANMIAIDPVTYSIDTSWPGNIGFAGYAQIIGAFPMPVIYNMRVASDGGIVCHRNDSKLLIKILSDGSGLDTSWGTNGEVDFSNVGFGYTMMREIDNYGDELFVFSRAAGGVITINHLDEDGAITDTKTFAGSTQYTYTCLMVFNDKLILAGNADDDVEIWTQVFEKESGFDLAQASAGIHFVLADETTRANLTDAVPGTEVPVEVDPRRLVSFTVSNEDSYVIAMGNEVMAFFR